MHPSEYRGLLPRTYEALVANFGQPTEIQLAAAGPLLAGRDAVLCAPTAAGKTVAYAAPLIEAHVQADADPGDPRVLVVTPTRALVNDLHRRLSGPLGRIHVDVGRWTGDHHDGGRLHSVTVLTPEGLDSRLSRAPRCLRSVRAVVLDELHVLDGTPRGDQLRVLVARMRAERAPGEGLPLQVVAASATVPDLGELAARYLVDAALVQVGSRRKVRAAVVQGRDPASVREALEQQVRAGFRKVLLFCNTREQVEVLSRYLNGRPPFRHAVLAHHGSLARQRRLAAEARFLRAPAAVCVCTSTMELGVDIGDIDLVALHGVPPDVPSLLQRVGRGGRRQAVNHVVAFVEGSYEAAALRRLLQAQAAGEWFPGPRVFYAGVLVQQAVSALQARRSLTIDAASLRRRLPPDLIKAWPEHRLEAVLRMAAGAGLLAPTGAGGRYALGARGEQIWGRGQLHANLGDAEKVKIFDTVTGDEIGEVSDAMGGLGLGGRDRHRVFAEDGRVVTRSSSADVGALPVFGGGSAPSLPAALARALLDGAGIPVPCRSVMPGGFALFHGLGRAGARLLQATFKDHKRGPAIAHTGPLSLVFQGELEEAHWPRGSMVRQVLAQHHRGIGKKLELGAWHGVLPDEERREIVGQVCGAPAVAAFLDAGLPPLISAADEILWNEAAWTA